MSLSLNSKEILKTAEKTLTDYKLCDHCLGRIFAKIEIGLTNQKRGQLIREHLKINKKTQIKNCSLCSGLCNEITHFANLILDVLDDYEFETFLIGVKVDEDILDREEKLFEFAGSEYSESIKSELKREIGKILEKKLDKEVDFNNPTIMAVIDTSFDVVNLQITPVFVYGRYKKYRRDVPQTKWFCKICRGKGCRNCDYTGKMYETSVEELISTKFLEATKAEDESFHGCGREDIDVKMLGNGRPFILEIKDPKIRQIDLSQLELDVNASNRKNIEVSELRFSSRDKIAKLKKSEPKKIYRVVLKGEKALNYEKLKKAAQSLRGVKIGQLTPSRVVHRRANMVREKYIYDCKIVSLDGFMAILTLETESGTYIKELVSGDNGRTNPNISEMIGIPCEVTELDVIEIKGEC